MDDDASFIVVAIKPTLFGATAECEATVDTILQRTMMTLDYYGSNSLAFYRTEIRKGERLTIKVRRTEQIKLQDRLASQWVADHAKFYRRWSEGRLGKTSNFPHI